MRPEPIGLRWFGVTFLVAVALNFPREMAQAYLYEPMGDLWQATRRCFIASIGDGAMVLFVLTVTRLLWRRLKTTVPGWNAGEYVAAIALSVAVAVAVEWWGLSQGRWVYQPEMPRVPGTPFGVAPLAQLAILTPVVMFVAHRSTGLPAATPP